VNTQTRDDVFPIDTYLRSVNVTAYSVANIAATDVIPLDTPLGTVNTTVASGVIRVVTEPIVDSGTPVSVSLVAIESDGVIIDITSANLITQDVTILMDSNVSGLDHVSYSYSIPWENRTSLGNLSQYGQYTYDQVDSIVFQSPINISQVLEKKAFPFIVYIDTHGAQVDPSFSNLTQVEQDFQDTPFLLPPSTLNIISKTNVTPNIPFDPTVSYAYNLTLLENETNYTLPVGSLLVDTNYPIQLNSTVKLNISAVSMGTRVVAINGVSLPS
jgi:hypothetical protein